MPILHPHYDGPLSGHFAALPPAWRAIVAPPDAAAVRGLDALCRFVDARADSVPVVPAQPFAALHATAPDDARIVVLGQDPYHGDGQAHGFAFSVPAGVRPPPSLRNIFEELARDLGSPRPVDGDLRRWAARGVLLLNAVLTVELDRPASHAGKGWEAVTDRIIAAVAGLDRPKAFLLWGAVAQRHRAAIERAAGRNGIFEANHPSPLAARRPPRPFIGCGHFSAANAYLKSNGEAPVDWAGR